MPSIRSHIVRFYLKRALRRDSGQTYQQRRKKINRSSNLFKTARGITCSPVEVGSRSGEWIVPNGAKEGVAILYLHGGAYTLGSIDSHRAIASQIAAACQIQTLLLEYRLAPEHPYPAALEDSVSAFLWMQSELDIAADRIVIVGDSAGGGLSIATAIRLRNTGWDMPRALVCLSSWTDLSMSGSSVQELLGKDPFFTATNDLCRAASAYAGVHPLTHPEISPRYANLRGLPDLYVQVGANEILLSDSVDLVQAAQVAGVNAQVDIWPGMWHVWQVFHDQMPEARCAVLKIGKKIKAYLS